MNEDRIGELLKEAFLYSYRVIHGNDDLRGMTDFINQHRDDVLAAVKANAGNAVAFIEHPPTAKTQHEDTVNAIAIWFFIGVIRESGREDVLTYIQRNIDAK